MKILITGANGLVGQSLGQELVRRGHEINALVRDPIHARQKMTYPCRLFKWKGDSTIETAALDGVEAIVHLAGESIAGVRWTSAKKKAIYDSRIDGTRLLIESVKSHPEVQKKLKCLVQASATGYYGDRADEWLTEKDHAGSDFLAQVARDWEFEGAKIKGVNKKIRHVSVRTGIVLSDKGGALQPLLKLFSNGGGAPLAGGHQWMSWIHLADITGVYAHAIESELEGPINGVAPHPVTNRDFTAFLAANVHQWVLPSVPKPVLKIAMGEMSEMILVSTRASAELAIASGYQFKYAQLNTALKDICRDMQAGSSVLASEQWVAAPLNDVFKFFSDANNLEELTPKYLHFEIKSMSTPEIEEGSLIDYKLKLHGIPMHWRTRIDVWKPAAAPNSAEFVDRQLEGPYRQWHHTHEFETLGHGTLIRDRVVYKLPLGAAGRLVAGLKVASDVKGIFDYRRKQIAERF